MRLETYAFDPAVQVQLEAFPGIRSSDNTHKEGRGFDHAASTRKPMSRPLDDLDAWARREVELVAMVVA